MNFPKSLQEMKVKEYQPSDVIKKSAGITQVVKTLSTSCRHHELKLNVYGSITFSKP